jgi:hypothetical protein
MLKKIVAAAAVAGALGLVAGPAMAENACVHFDINVNGTTQVIDQCV